MIPSHNFCNELGHVISLKINNTYAENHLIAYARKILNVLDQMCWKNCYASQSSKAEFKFNLFYGTR